ncbi:efflux RND transporter periplasmic adaptor subunit [Maribacter halichondriae]|uniref:efflux RND transporter periplasmic adaptor subunit n=1 Tax=Maribacter halichondriae TaxID=2980554 RepID=UPI00235A06D4|nr:efflux RND transporter periplasmic adaptor subunit [Maribacter sp. Hal144]
MIKKYGTYLALLAAGLVLGYLIFGTTEKENGHTPQTEKDRQAQWTCSMHPQISKTEKGDCPLCGMDLIAVDTGGDILEANQFRMSENAMALANIETTTIGVNDLENNTLVLSGVITSNEKTNAVQTTIFDGRIEKLNVNYVGEYVKKGQQIGVIYAPEMYTAQDRLLTSSSFRESNPKLWAATRNTMGLWKMTDRQIDEVLQTGKPMFNFPLIADVSGTVTEIMAAEGQFYNEGDPLYKVSNLYTVWAVFDAYENQLPLLNMGQDILITSKAFDDKKLEAKISFVEPILDPTKRTVSVRVTLNNKQQLLKPGMFVQGTVAVDGASQVLTVPKSSVLWTGKRSLVYVKTVSDEPVFEIAEVTLGNVMGDFYTILEGLNPGDEVVTNGTFTVDAAAQLQGKKSMMGAKDKNIASSNMEGEPIALNLDSTFQAKFTKIIHSYIAIKDALIATDTEKTMARANALLKELNALDITSMEAVTRSNIQGIIDNAAAISEAADIAEQRQHFKPLSQKMVNIASNLKNLNQPVYVQHCPMADGNKGADWLSFENKVLNPYFGDKMLTCGSVTQTIQ